MLQNWKLSPFGWLRLGNIYMEYVTAKKSNVSILTIIKEERPMIWIDEDGLQTVEEELFSNEKTTSF